jgi:hypothetical protein
MRSGTGAGSAAGCPVEILGGILQGPARYAVAACGSRVGSAVAHSSQRLFVGTGGATVKRFPSVDAAILPPTNFVPRRVIC